MVNNEKNYSNPFSRIRAEQMGNSAWKYYVNDPFKEYIGEKPLIFEGSRGSGKTMFFLCNSWREKLDEAFQKKEKTKDFITNNKHIGFYYKADGRFCYGLKEKGISEDVWTGVFNTYVNIVISMEILSFVKKIKEEDLITTETINKIIKKCCSTLGIEVTANLDDLLSAFDDVIISIEHFCNDTDRNKPIGLNAGSLIERIINLIKEDDLFKNTTFHIFIDEFEVFLECQQIELNTLLKQSNSKIVYDFGVITKGIYTYKTKSNLDIQPKDDFVYFKPEEHSYSSSETYNKLLIDICKKRLEVISIDNNLNLDEEKFDIKFYLKYYGKSVQIKLFENKQDKLQDYKKVINSIIDRYANYYTVEQVSDIKNTLTECSPINLRMHQALLLRKGKDAILPGNLATLKQNKSKEYKDWEHNMEGAIVFLLCHELKVPKLYHGFSVFSILSAGIIRSFLELVEYTFDYAFNNGFTLTTPRPFTLEEQTDAAKFVSQYKISEIDSYGANGIHLKKFTLALGKIFNNIHTNPNATLGEVEQNHFETKISDLKIASPHAYGLLRQAVMYNILQEENSTKTKSDEVIELVDYHLNHIYCPAFKISHLRKRKISIKAEELAKLLGNSHKELEEVVNKLSKVSDNNEPNLFNS